MTQSLGDKIRDYRHSRGWTLQYFAEQLGVTDAAIGHWETGIREPSKDKLIILAKMMHCTVDDLINPHEPEGGFSDPAYERLYDDM